MTNDARYYVQALTDGVGTKIIAGQFNVGTTKVKSDRRIIKSGGSILYNGQIISNKEDISQEQQDTTKISWDGEDGTVDITSDNPVSEADVLAKFRSDSASVSIVGVLSESHWGDDENGWKHSYKFKTHRSLHSEADMQELFSIIENDKFDKPKHRDSKTMCVVISDLQVGKCDDLGGTEELLKRVRESLSKAVESAKQHNPSEIIIMDTGDIVENIGNVSTQLATNDLQLTDQIRIARRFMLEVVRELAPLAPRVVYAAVPSNHGRNRQGLKFAPGDTNDDWGLEISYQIEDALSLLPDVYKHVKFVRPDGLNEYALIDIHPGKDIVDAIIIAHGHQAGNINKLADWWKGIAFSDQDYRAQYATYGIFGHYHTFKMENPTTDRWLMVAPTSDNGSAWFRNTKGATSNTGFLSFFVPDSTDSCLTFPENLTLL